MKTCVIYAASIFDSSKMNVIYDFFNSFKTHFSDADFYIGVNWSSLPNLENVIESFGLTTKMTRVPEERLYTKTDASAYQAALRLLRDSGNKYDVYWFAHTKGGVNHRPEVRDLYFNEMFGKRKEIESMFEKYPKLGSWGIRGNSISAAGVEWNKYNVDCGFPICQNAKNITPFNYTHVNWSYIETMYVLKKEAVEAYLLNQPDTFYTTPLNPWYFETVMPWVPSRCGYFPYVKIKRDFWERCDLTDITKEWIKENNLNEQEYTDLLS